jgi:chromosome segregation ATPase
LQLKDDKQLQSFVQKYAVSDRDALQVYNQEYDLSKELGFESQRNSNVHQYRTSSQCSISHHDLKLIKENEWLQKQLKELKDTIKKAKDNRNTMYFRNDRKMIELKKVYNEKEKLSEKCRTLEAQYHNLKMLHFDKSEELREDKVKFDKLNKDFESLKASFDNDKQRAVQKAEKPLKARTVSLEYDLRICKDKLKMSKWS